MKNSLWILFGIWVFVALLFAYGAVTIPADAMIPIHWNAQFEVDDWAGKWTALSFGPAICTLMPLLFWLLPKIEPRKKHLQDSMFTLSVILVSVQFLMAAIYLGMVLIATGVDFDINKVVIIGIGLLFLVIGNYLGKVRSNFLLGIRTPWTLSSENVWNKTHRLAGKLFMLVGLLSMVIGFLKLTWGFYVFIVAVLLMVVGIFVYSWFLFDREQKQLNSSEKELSNE